MSEYRLKSGQSLPSLGGGALPNLPKINSLKGNAIAPAPQTSKGTKPLPSYASLTVPKTGSSDGRSSSIPKLSSRSDSESKSSLFSSRIDARSKPKDSGSSSVETDLSGFELADDAPTEVGSADDLLAAMSGIDSWNEVSSLGENGVLGTQTIAQSFEEIANTMAACDDGDDCDEPTVIKAMPLRAPSGNSEDLPSKPELKSGQHTASPSMSGIPKAPSVPEVPPTSLVTEVSPTPPMPEVPPTPPMPEVPPTPPMPEVPPAPPAPPVPEVPPAPPMPEVSPTSPVTEVSPAPSVPEVPPPAPEVPPAPPVPEVPPAPPVPEVPPAPPVPEVPPAPPVSEVPPAPPVSEVPPAPPVSEVPPAPPVPEVPQEAQSPAVSASATDNMSDEEQLQALLSAMTPEERVAYETHCFEEQARATQERMARQRELHEMYGESSPNRTKTPVGLVIAIVVIVLGLVGGLVYFVASPSEPVEDEVAEQAVEEEPLVAERTELKTYKVTVNIEGATSLYVNGQAASMGEVDFVEGRKNTVIAYAPHMVPYFETFPANQKVTDPIEAALESDVLYEKGRVEFRFTAPEQESLRYTVRFDGQPISDFPRTLNDVVLGRPHILTLETPNFAKHLHIIWCDDRDNTVTIPELKAANDALRGTEATMKRMPKPENAYAYVIKTGHSEVRQPIVATVTPGDMIEYSVAREQRKPLNIAVIPDGYGSLALDMALLRKSIGESVVSFRRADKGSDYRVCMRRVGEVVCPSMEGETTVPSGNDWVFFGVVGSEVNAVVLRGAQKQELQSSRKYVFETQVDKNKTFSYRQVGYQSIKKKD